MEPLFQVTVPAPVDASVSTAPAYSVLNSLALLNHPERASSLHHWVSRLMTALSPEQQQTNRIIFDGLAHALIVDEDWPSFPAYLQALSDEAPEQLRDRAVRRLAMLAGLSDVDSAELLSDEQLYLNTSERLWSNEPVDLALQRQVYALLNDAPAMRMLIVEHLRTLWDLLAKEWTQGQGNVNWFAATLQERVAAGLADETINTFIGLDLTEGQKIQLATARHIVFVPSKHLGSHAQILRGDAMAWVFFGISEDRALLLRRAPVGASEMALRLGALADETRLRMLALIIQHGELSAQEIIAQLELPQPTASRHLKYLAMTGYIHERREGGAAKVYRVRPTYLALTFQTLERFLQGNDRARDPEAQQSATLRRFLDTRGRVTTWPAKRQDRQLVLGYLANKFGSDQHYTEKEVNTLLSQWHTYEDPATLRRELYDAGLLERERTGRTYWRTNVEAAV